MNSKTNYFEPQLTFHKSDSLIYLTSSCTCYSCGSVSQVFIPTPLLLPLEENEKISYIFNGSLNFAFFTSHKRIFVTGKNRYGQLGLGDTLERFKFVLFSLPNNEKISFISCGVNHSICVTENDLCYVWGWNSYGQLGLGDRKNRLSPTLLTLPNNERIRFINCGSSHSTCLTENNLCYVWGWNAHGELGLGSYKDQLVPTLLGFPNNEKISFIHCGGYHTTCFTKGNDYYIWGWNAFGQLGFGDKSNRSVPHLLTLPNNEQILYLTTGVNHTVCLTENHLCYVWGNNNSGQLGLGDTNNRTTPTLLALPNNEKISFITCGTNHTVCLTENNLCYVWGNNKYGQLGLGDKNDRSSPTLLQLSEVNF